jgi:hypothetical protein
MAVEYRLLTFKTMLKRLLILLVLLDIRNIRASIPIPFFISYPF